MIPTRSPPSLPTSSGNLLFHAIINDSARSFFLSGPDGPNGMCLHYEVGVESRKRGVKLRETAIRADDLDAALEQLREFLPDYQYAGPWLGQKP